MDDSKIFILMQSSQQSDQQKPKKLIKMPKLSYHRVRAHVNPFNQSPFGYPLSSDFVDWKLHIKDLKANIPEHPIEYNKLQTPSECKPVIVDIGCGFGGLLFELANIQEKKYIMGMQIRCKVVQYVRDKIAAMRELEKGRFNNIGVVRTNTMRHLIQYFQKQSLEKIFICFPDPHFKQKNHRRRIINPSFLSQYAYLLKPRGRLYCITDVQQLNEWHLKHLQKCRLLRRLQLGEEQEYVKGMLKGTQQGRKAQREGRKKHWLVYQKIEQIK